jgi:hypothetical protein
MRTHVSDAVGYLVARELRPVMGERIETGAVLRMARDQRATPDETVNQCAAPASQRAGAGGPSAARGRCGADPVL